MVMMTIKTIANIDITLCARHCLKNITCINLFTTHKNLLSWVLLLSFFSIQGNRDTERLNNLPKVT